MKFVRECHVCKQAKFESEFLLIIRDGMKRENNECKECFRQRFVKALEKGAPKKDVSSE